MKAIYLIIALLCLSNAATALDTSQPTNNFLEIKHPQCSCTANYTFYPTTNTTIYQNTTESDPVAMDAINGNMSAWLATNNETYDAYATNVSKNWSQLAYDMWNEIWASTFNTTYALWAYNQTENLDYAGFYSTYNATYAAYQDTNDSDYIHANEEAWSIDIDTNDSAYIHANEEAWSATYNATYENYASNVSKNWSQLAYDMWNAIWSIDIDTNDSAYIHERESDWDSKYNETYATWAYNQTENLDYAGFYSTYNATYAAKAYADSCAAGQYVNRLSPTKVTCAIPSTYNATYHNCVASGTGCNSVLTSTYNSTYDAKVSSQWQDLPNRINYNGNVSINGTTPNTAVPNYYPFEVQIWNASLVNPSYSKVGIGTNYYNAPPSISTYYQNKWRRLAQVGVAADSSNNDTWIGDLDANYGQLHLKSNGLTGASLNQSKDLILYGNMYVGTGGARYTSEGFDNTDVGFLDFVDQLLFKAEGDYRTYLTGSSFYPAYNDQISLGTTTNRFDGAYFSDYVFANHTTNGYGYFGQSTGSYIAFRPTFSKIAVNGADELILSSTALYPYTDDGWSLGLARNRVNGAWFSGDVNVSANYVIANYKSSDGTIGMTATKTFYTSPTDGGLPTILNTVTIKDGLITAWTQA